MAVSIGLGVASVAIGLLSFTTSLIDNPDPNSNMFRLRLGENGYRGLSGAGGTKPDTRIWSPAGDFIGLKVNDNNRCRDGDQVCDYKVNNVRRDPDYALFTANNDAICISSFQSHYPDDTEYFVVIGNWARECSENQGITTATWFYTPNMEKTEERGAVPVDCSWMDRDGDQPTTGIQIYWPRYDSRTFPAQSSNPGQFCGDHTVLYFHVDDDPNYVVLPGNLKRSDQANAAPEPFLDARRKDGRNAITKRSGSSHQFSHQLVKSHLPQRPASDLCNAKASAGPSFASYDERMFCFMPTKHLFPFCADVASGACWSEDLNIVTPKLIDVLVPAMNFTEVAEWTEFIIL